ncbi:MAG: hypothetical protein P8L16_07590 [Ilumatobacter sp.]|nr:hypothetical protein [Ilumatobacter sp.]
MGHNAQPVRFRNDVRFGGARSRFDVVLLDEPTNDLDHDGLERPEQLVLGLAAPVLVVSHDRTFLEGTVTDVVEIDHHTLRHLVLRRMGSIPRRT